MPRSRPACRTPATSNGAQQEGYGVLRSYHRKGERCSNAAAYLRGAEQRPNLTVITGAHATRVLLEDGRAVGVQYRRAAAITRCARRASWCSAAAPSTRRSCCCCPAWGRARNWTNTASRSSTSCRAWAANLQDHLDLYVVTKAKTRVGFSFHPTSWPKAVLGLLLYAFFRRGYLTSNLVEAGASCARCRRSRFPICNGISAQW